MLCANTRPFYIMDLSIRGFWYGVKGPRINPPQIPRDHCIGQFQIIKNAKKAFSTELTVISEHLLLQNKHREKRNTAICNYCLL